jgi:uncharacterized protein
LKKVKINSHMKHKILLQFISLIIVFIYPAESIFSQTRLDHNDFIKEIRNSGNIIYGECLQKYNLYLSDHPDDIMVLIEKCKFIQSAQYDDENEINPNQEEFDSCLASLARNYPKSPDVILFRIENSYGDELKEIFRTAELLVEENPQDWSKTNLGKLYEQIADQYFTDSEYKNADKYIQKAINADETIRSSLLHARILKELNRPEEALDILTSGKDTSGETWQLVQKANLLLELKDYTDAVELFNVIFRIDSTYNNNYELAKSLEGIGSIELSRKYLLRDTSSTWGRETAIKNLLIHDLKYQAGDTCIATYNKYRSLGYKVDPLSLYRLKLFIAHPFQAWKIRDFAGLFTLIGLIILLLVVPSIWILPVYFIGTYWNFKNREKLFKIHWGLKWFWFISFVYLFSSLIIGISSPDYLYSQFSFPRYNSGIGQQDLGRVTFISILVLGTAGLAALYRKDLKVLLFEGWSVKKSILMGIGLVLAFKFVSGIYIQIGALSLGTPVEELTTIPNILFSSKQEIQALIATYGKVIGFILICLFVPVYEEVIFRGIILDSCQKYLNFNAANFIQAALFGIVHLNLFLFPVFFMFGFITGLLRKHSQGLLSGMVFHSVNNALAISLMLIT